MPGVWDRKAIVDRGTDSIWPAMNRVVTLCICCCYCCFAGSFHGFAAPPQSVAFANNCPVVQAQRGAVTSGSSAASQSWSHSRCKMPSADWNACSAAVCGVFAALFVGRGGFPSHSRLQRGGRSAVVCRAVGSDVGVVLLSAGVGKRMGASIPKQYIKLMGLEIALHSLDTFLACDVAEIVIVCAEDWQYIFQDHLDKKGSISADVKFTTGGKERQDSVSNGLAKITAPIVAIHDAARPLVTEGEVEKVVADAREHGAALLAVRTKATIKQAVSESEAFVEGTPKRKLLWEAHTPQVIQSELLRKGFENAEKEGLDVTDDVSLVEQLGEKVKLTEGEYTNIKVTTPEDIAVAETILKERGFLAPEA